GSCLSCRPWLLVVRLVVYDFGVDDVFVVAFRLGRGAAVCGLLGLALCVDLFTDLLLALVQLVERGLDGRVVFAGERCLERVDVGLDFGLDAIRQLFVVLFDEFLGGVDELLGGVANLGGLTALLVFCRVLFAFAHHALDVFLREGRATGDEIGRASCRAGVCS